MAFWFWDDQNISLNIEKTCIMNIYNDYLQEIEERKGRILAESRWITKQSLHKLKIQITHTAKVSLQFFIYNTVPGTTSCWCESYVLKDIILVNL
jgi:hypothetical protein